ncbi:hypothetical protein [Roseovarius nanhaiticus]|uniref:hypothetical protein n=1 Tax=Roseovarius nanhaiticus TaxID=573024 RepID=UPI0024901B98|nr:hypothetical protein [Roseovarius nanhaiticus]
MVKLNLTFFLIMVTIFSKLIGFVREMMLLGNVGISAGLDLLVIFFSFTMFLTGVIGTCVVTNMTPVMATRSSHDAVATFLVESVKVAIGISLIAVLWNFVYLKTALADHPEAELAAQLAVLMVWILLFSVIAEYQVALFLSQNRQIPVISGNIMISLPLVIGMVFFDITILAYAIGLAIAFALRIVIFAVLLRPSVAMSAAWWRAQLMAKPLLFVNVPKILKGGSAMLSIGLIFLVAMILAERQSVGAATLVGYGRKIPMLILTSVWFVLGSRFFSQIVQQRGQGSHALIAKLTKFNTAVTIALAAGVLASIGITHLYADQMADVALDFAKVINASLPLLPIIIFVPIIEMTQRTLVTLDKHGMVMLLTYASMAVAIIGFGLSVWIWDSPFSIMLTITVALGAGALPAVLALNKIEKAP